MSAVDFYYDVVCPYAYLAFRQLAAVREHAEVRLHPILLGGLLREVGGPDDPNTVMAPARAAVGGRDLAAWASLWGVPLRMPAEHPRRSVDAMRVLAGAPPPSCESLSAALYAAYWEHGADIAQHEVLEPIVASHGLALDELLVVGRDRLRANTSRAADAGAFGVPTFVGPRRLLWGQDRLGLLLRDLGRRGSPEAWMGPDDPPQPQRVRRIRFFHDFASPFSYLAATQIDRIATEHGVEVEWSPVLVGGLFRSIGTPDVPLFEMNPTKQAYARRDLSDWAEAWGVRFAFPTAFPLRSVLALRAALVEPGCALAIYRAVWVDDRRVDDPAVLEAVLGEAGFQGSEIVAATSTPAIKSALRRNGEQAIASGACGVPTVVVEFHDGDPAVLWGQDRLVMLRAVLRGWTPPAR